MTGELVSLSVRRGLDLSEFVEGVQDNRLGGRSAHRLAPAQLIPYFSVMVAGAFKEAGAAVGSVVHFHARQNPLELAQDVSVQIHQPRIFGRQKDRHIERLAGLPRSE